MPPGFIPVSTPAASGSDYNAVAGRFLPALDGLRAVAVAGVVAYHLDAGWASGGYLGVDLFFVLSGFLITSLLVEEWCATGRIRLARFWGRRARRLLPALLLMLVVVCAFSALASGGIPVDFSQLRGDALATLAYVANWHFIFAHQSYFDRTSLPSPLKHTWSLAIEEQFYLVWPLVILGLMGVVGRRQRRRRTRGTSVGAHGKTHQASPAGSAAPVEPNEHAPGEAAWRRPGIVVTGGGALASAAWMAYLALHGASVNRLYYGTDTRAFDLLAGATLAMLVAARPQPGAAARRVLASLSPLAVAVLALCWVESGTSNGDPRRIMFEGGFLLCAVAATVVVADVRQVVPGPLARALSIRPLRFLGRISYGIYLWHWPAIVELSPGRTGLSGLPLDGVRVGATLVVATASYYLVERPIRRGALATLPSALRLAAAPFGILATAVVVIAATAPAAVATPAPSTRVSTPQQPAPDVRPVAAHPIELGFHPTRSHRLRVLLIGDSVMLSDSPAVQALLESTGVATVVNRSQWGWGLTSAKNWRHEIDAWVTAARPQLVIGMWSWDNVLAAEHPVLYRAELASLVREMLGLGVEGVIFQQFPEPGPDAEVTVDQAGYDAGVRSRVDNWNAIAASLSSLFPGRVTYFPIGASILLHGRFADWLPPEGAPDAPVRDWVRVRMVDNVHFCPAGAARYAAALFADLQSVVRLPSPTPRWWDGAWRLNHVAYRYPTPAVCPDDHP